MKLPEPSNETAVKWLPVADIPDLMCETWRIQTGDNFEVIVEGDFLTDDGVRTLVIEFINVFALAAHEDMGGKTMAKVLEQPTIGKGAVADYRWPLVRIENSGWLASLPVPVRDFSHYLLTSFTCSVEAIAETTSARWR